MKLAFKTILVIALISIKAEAFNSRPIILITYGQWYEKAQTIKSILVKKLNIPKILINIYRVDTPCTPQKRAVMHICLDQYKKMRITHTDNEVIKESFRIFLKN